MADLLSQRRQWFSFFPEGTIEFLVVSRVFALMLAAALIIVPSTQRSVVLVAISGTVWLDYMLILWWLMHLAGDLDRLFVRETAPSSSALLKNYVLIFAPSVLALLAIAPWPGLVLRRAATHGHLVAFIPLVFGLLFLASVPIAYGRLRREGLPAGLWTVVLLVPIAHFFALHRLLGAMHLKIRDRAVEQGLPVAKNAGSGVGVVAADVLLAAGVLFGVAWGGLLSAGRTGGGFLAVIQMGALAFGAFFAITEVAALEYLQRRFVALIRRSGTAGAGAAPREEN